MKAYADLLADVVMKAQTGDDAQSKYLDLLTAVGEKRHQLLVQLFHIILKKTLQDTSARLCACVCEIGQTSLLESRVRSDKVDHQS